MAGLLANTPEAPTVNHMVTFWTVLELSISIPALPHPGCQPQVNYRTSLCQNSSSLEAEITMGSSQKLEG